MKFIVLQENLRNSVSLTSHFTSPKAQLPILGNILLRASKSKLILSATNLETSVSTSIGAKIESEGEITVNGKTLNDVISNLSSGSIEIEVIQEQLKITSGNFKSNLLGSNSADFPTLPDAVLKSSFKFDRENFVNSLSKVLFAVSNDETRPILTGVLFTFRDKTLYLVATDGFRLSEVKLKGEVDTPDFKIIIPKAVLHEIIKLNESESVEVSFDNENNQVIFAVGDTVLSSRIIEGEFPDYEKIIPKTNSGIITIGKLEFEKAIKLASVFARDAGNIVKLQITEKSMTLRAESSASGNQEMEIEINTKELSEEKIEIMFNYRFIEEALKVIIGDEIEIHISGQSSASKFLDPKVSNYLHIIMPIKTN